MLISNYSVHSNHSIKVKLLLFKKFNMYLKTIKAVRINDRMSALKDVKAYSTHRGIKI